MEKKLKSTEKYLARLPFWEDLTEEEKAMVLDRATIRLFEKNQIINSSDASCMGIVYIIKGGIRVCLLSDEGREITLYRLGEGDPCVTTASCVIQQITFDTLVYATEESKMLVIPSNVCSYLSKSSMNVRLFIYETETQRFSQAIWVLQEILFKRFDQRLAAYLLKASEENGGPDLRMTQEEIAKDVNSAREVVARMLRHFSSEGLVKVKRGHILITDPEGLENLL